MTTKILTGFYIYTYMVGPPVTTLSIAASGYLANGLASKGSGAYSVVNSGVLHGFGAISLTGAGQVVSNYGAIRSSGSKPAVVIGGGRVANGAGGLISGYDGVDILGAAGTLTNLGRIEGTGPRGAILFGSGASVVNGSSAVTTALIEGAYGIDLPAGGVVDNYGTVLGLKDSGIGVTGGTVTNGSATDPAALISGVDYGVVFFTNPGTVNTFGTVTATGTLGTGIRLENGGRVNNGSAADKTALVQGESYGVAAAAKATVSSFGTVAASYQGIAVQLKAGGLITNGSTGDLSARLTGFYGAVIQGAVGTVNNFAVIGGPHSESAILLADGGRVVNGGATDTAALAHGHEAIIIDGAAGTVVNFATVLADDAGGAFGGLQEGVYLAAGGAVTNGSSGDTAARIEAAYAIVSAMAATVSNFGLITADQIGVKLKDGGRVTNGSATDTTATIFGAGSNGLYSKAGPLNLTNFGTIANGEGGGSAVYSAVGGVLTNGGTSDRAALIEGFEGLVAADNVVVDNFATIAGEVSLGVGLGTGSVLNNEAGGYILGPTGVHVAAYATVNNFGTISAMTARSVDMTSPHAVLRAEAGSKFVGVISAYTGLVDVVAGVASATGIDSQGKLIGAGTLSLNGGVSQFSGKVSLGVAKIVESGVGTVVEIATNAVDGKIWDQAGGTLQIDGADKMTFNGTGNRFSGTVSGTGEVLLSGGADTFSNVDLTIANTVINKAAATFSGTVGIDGMVTATSTSLTVAAGGATLKGGGLFILSNNATNSLHGASAAAILTNEAILRGAGQLGGGTLSLVNSGSIESGFTNALIVDTGADTILNTGTIVALSGGGLIIASPVDNTGILETVGTLTAEAAVIGAGTVDILSGAALFAAGFNEAVVFGSSGRLALAHSASFTNTIAGFSHTGTTSLDLEDIGFSGTTKATFSGTTASGILTVTDGTHTAHIHLTGNYTAAKWTLTNDGTGGTKVVDPTKSVAHALAAAAAGLAQTPPGGVHPGDRIWSRPAPRLLAAAVHWA
ncbi:MAG TPA: hypothetical protein VGH15_02800 [Caulobacteraceae bacterium]|jgi:hypothetical protein